MNVIGMISGTSYDAIEAVAVQFNLKERTVRAHLVSHVSVPYEREIRSRVAAVLPPQSTTIDEVCRLDTQIGQAFAEIAAELSANCFGGNVDVVCSHGQTVFHWVQGGRAFGTLQIGQAAWIAEATGATVVSDVRCRDVAAGGQGAPLASLMDVLLLGTNPPIVRGALNLGGISNITVVGPSKAPAAFDIGPANALMDAAVTWLSEGRETFDKDGASAAKGKIDREVLEQFLAEPYFKESAPKSTGKELFHLEYLQSRLSHRCVSRDDLLATLCELTAVTVAHAVRGAEVQELFVSGGGTRNPVLMEAITRNLADTKVLISPIDDFGIPEAAKEAVLFALIGFMSVQGLHSNVASCTGASHAVILGAITPGRRTITALPEHDAPTRLVFESPLVGLGS